MDARVSSNRLSFYFEPLRRDVQTWLAPLTFAKGSQADDPAWNPNRRRARTRHYLDASTLPPPANDFDRPVFARDGVGQ